MDIKKPHTLLLGIMGRMASLWPEKLYLKIVYRLYMGETLNLGNPRTFQEKIQ